MEYLAVFRVDGGDFGGTVRDPVYDFAVPVEGHFVYHTGACAGGRTDESFSGGTTVFVSFPAGAADQSGAAA